MKHGATVLVFPAWTSNPFLNLLALAPAAQGYRFINRTLYGSVLAEVAQLGAGDTVHMHWTAPIAQDARTRRDAERRVDTVAKALRDAKARGVRVIWTIHNTLPHELRFAATENRLYRVLAELADAVHVMAPATRELVASVTEIPESKVVRIAHPSYAGIYDTGVTRADARASFGLADDEFAVLFLGQIRPYKGIDTLLSAIGEVNRTDAKRAVLMLAGAASPEAIDDVDALMPANVRAITSFTAVPDGDIARWYAAADVAVFPYAAILNSGSTHLAATLGVPVILPGLPHLRDEFAYDWVRFFDPTNAVSTLAEVLSDGGAFAGITRQGFDEFNLPISPWQTSRRYLALLDSL